MLHGCALGGARASLVGLVLVPCCAAENREYAEAGVLKAGLVVVLWLWCGETMSLESDTGAI